MQAAGSSVKRKRTIESCSECYRRKQKCDRKYPCNNCSARNVPAKCTFNVSTVPNPEGIRCPGISDQGGHMPSSLQDGQVSHQLGPDVLGYSSIPGSNAFRGLQQVHTSSQLRSNSQANPGQILGDAEFERISTSHNFPLNPSVSGNSAEGLLSKLPPRPMLQTLVDFFFAEVNWHYFILERFYFDDLFVRWPLGEQLEPVSYLSLDELSRELHYFPAVLFQVTSLALQFLPAERLKGAQIPSSDLAKPQAYSDLGERLLSLLGRPGATLSGVQADFLRASCLKNAGRGTEAWHILGSAIRQGQELGLHRHREIYQRDGTNIDKTLSLFWYNENKKRLWISLFAWDSLMAMILGRPRMIHRDDCDAAPPLECGMPKNPSTAIPMTVRHDENPGIIPVSVSLFQYAVACKVHDMREIKPDRPRPKMYSTVQRIHNDVDSMMDSLLPAIRPDCPDTSWDLELPYLPQLREELKVMANLVIVNLHRPHIISSPESRKFALQAAITTLNSQLCSFAQTNPHQYHLFGVAFYMVDASLLLSIISTLYPPENSETRQNIGSSLSRSLDNLSILKSHNPIAKAGFGVVQRCYRKLKEVFKSANGDAWPDTARHGSSIVRFHGLIQDLQDNNSTEPSIGSLLDPAQPNQTPNFEISTPPFDALPDSFDQGYWLEQLNQIQPSLTFGQDDNGIWENLSFD